MIGCEWGVRCSRIGGLVMSYTRQKPYGISGPQMHTSIPRSDSMAKIRYRPITVRIFETTNSIHTGGEGTRRL